MAETTPTGDPTQPLDSEARRQRALERARIKSRDLRRAAGRLLAVLDGDDAPWQHGGGAGDDLLAAARIVATLKGIELQGPDPRLGQPTGDPLQAIGRASKVRYRQVLLRGSWWQEDAGPLLAYSGKEKRPVALVPQGEKGYVLVDPRDGERLPVTEDLASKLAPHAITFYRPFPLRALGLADVLAQSTRDIGRDLWVVAALGAAGGLLAMFTPILTEGVFDHIIPGADRGQLLQVLLILLVAAFATGAFELVRRIAMLRIEGAMDAASQPAIWDRLLALPVPFFNRFTAGELAIRSMAVNDIQQLLAGSVLSGVLGLVFGSFNFALLFYYDRRLALFATLVVVVAFLVTFTVGAVSLRFERRAQLLRQSISGQLLQYLTAISKLRITGTESTAFSLWATRFAEQRTHELRARIANNVLTVFNTGLPILGALLIYYRVEKRLAESPLSTGAFLAFMAAFVAFLGAVTSFGSALVNALRVVPLYENAKPILETLPEVDTARSDPGELAGKIELVDVHYRYTPDGPLVLNGLSFEIEPGQFVALVGPSGAGKSTVMRLLLGFDTPEAGTVLYDDQDLAGLDLTALRQRLGVVLQSGRLVPGDILTNIVGASSGLTIDDAWEAARSAGLEKDIKAMPMGMYTMAGNGTLSGGQEQRLLIARALVKKPRIVLMDEATSALDNITQEIVRDSLDRLAATRVVIAHRLSTIRRADRILLIDKGAVKEQGSYEELMALGGEFHALAERQIA